MKTGAYGNLTQIKAGLEILQSVDATAAVVIRQNIVHVPDVLFSDLTPTQQTDMTTAGWKPQIVEGGYFYSLSYP